MIISVDAPGLRSDTEIREWLRGRTIAIPGEMTSAFLALQLYLGEFEFIVVPFEQIFDAVKSRRAAAGLIIHEGQLTYARSGIVERRLVADRSAPQRSSFYLIGGLHVRLCDIKAYLAKVERLSSSLHPA